MKKLVENKQCRICKSTYLRKVFDFGTTPPANAFLTKKQLKQKENRYPLMVNFCKHCGLLQLSHTVDPKILFKNYVYASSTSTVFVDHFKSYARTVVKFLKLPKRSLVIDIGSNDGILLKPFKDLGMNVLGVEPAENIAKIANKAGLPTLSRFFSPTLARTIKKKYGQTSVITANNVFAHINDIDQVVEGVLTLLTSNGVFVTESAYLVDFLEKNLFDTIYHEHLSYYAVRPLITFFRRFGMRIFHVERVSSHGGSIRIFAARNDAIYAKNASVSDLVELEEKMKLHTLKPYIDFSKRVGRNKETLTKLLQRLKKKGKRIAGYGAPAKGNTLLNYFRIDKTLLDFIIDDSLLKQKLYTPGTHIPVVSPIQLLEKKPDYLLILAWNFAGALMKTHHLYHDQGGKFIIPVPTPTVI